MRKGCYLSGTLLAVAAIIPAYGQNNRSDIVVVNDLKRKIKVCYYNRRDHLPTVGRECITIAAGKSGKFKKAQRGSRYQVRVFIPGIVDYSYCWNKGYDFPANKNQRIHAVGGKKCVEQRAIPKPAPPATPPPAPVAEHDVGDIIMVGIRDNPNNRARRYFPAEVTASYNIAGRYIEYRYKQLNGRRGRIRDEHVKEDMIGVGTQILAKQINSNSIEFARVTRRAGRLMRVEFNDGTDGYVDLRDVRVDEEDYPDAAQPKDTQPAWVIRMCNETSGRVKGAVGFKPKDGIEFSYGWFNAKANSCADMPIGGAFEPPEGWHENTQYVYAYAERVDAGGVRRPVVAKPARAKSYCVKLGENWSASKQRSFGVVWAHCDKVGNRMVPFSSLPLPNGGGIIDWTF